MRSLRAIVAALTTCPCTREPTSRGRCSLRKIVATLFTGAAIWAYVGIAVWFFLATPYAVSATKCWDGREASKAYQCLKPVAQKLRKDSIIATYATATVAAIIALQLANRNRAEATRRGDSSS